MAEEPLAAGITVRPAAEGEAAALTALCHHSKRHWGYDDLFMHRARPALTVDEKDIASGWVLVAEGGGVLCGVSELTPLADPAHVELDKLFIAPEAIGQGVGRLLLDAACRFARSRGFTTMEILADPNAAPFYERMGARFQYDAPSDVIPGRTLPLYNLNL